MLLFMLTIDCERLCNHYYEQAVKHRLAEPTTDEGKRRFIASEMISRAKAKAALITHYGSNIPPIGYCEYQCTHDIDFSGNTYEVKARRGEYDYDWFTRNRPMMPLRKTKDSSHYLTITSDGYAICWKSDGYSLTAQTIQDKTNETHDTSLRVEPYAYYDLTSALWVEKLDYRKFKKIDKAFEIEEQAYEEYKLKLINLLRHGNTS